MKPLFATALILAAGTAAAHGQIARISAPEPLLRGVQSDLHHPVLSPDGKRLLVSSADYSNLRVHDFDLGTTRTVSRSPRAGFGATFSPDGLTIAYSPAGHGVTVTVADDTLYITTPTGRIAASPVEAPAYLWPSVSPDGSRVMFVAAGRGVYITDLTGAVVSYAGDYEAPVWVTDQCIAAMLATDDGHQLSTSQVVLVRPDGSQMQPVTRPESMTGWPTAAAGRLVYATVDGLLYQVTVSPL